MKPVGLTLLTLLVLFTPVLTLVPAAIAQDPTTGPDARESTYPDPIRNITHEPWTPTRGEDIHIAVTLQDEAKTPDRVQLIWCRIEPEYVCAQPVAFREEPAHTWTATIPGSSGGERDVIRDTTRHIGYNVSLVYDGPAQAERIFAPTHNTWAPTSFPQDSGGMYYFLDLGEPGKQAPGPPVALIALAALAWVPLVLILRRRTGGEPTG